METFEEHYESMSRTILQYMPAADMGLIDRAVEYAREKHKEQKRKDGSPYIIHPLAVAEIVAEMGLDMDAVLGALLHDCIEDTDASHDEIEKLFGVTVAELVEEMEAALEERTRLRPILLDSVAELRKKTRKDLENITAMIYNSDSDL